MKKNILTLCLGLGILFTSHVNAQGFYTEISGGFGWALGENQLGTETYTDNVLETSGEIILKNGSYERPIKGTLGGGSNISITPGYMITKNLGVELGVNYFQGAETTINRDHNPEPENFGYSKTTAYSNQLRLIPSLVYKIGGDSLLFFAKIGAVLPVTGATYGKTVESEPVTLPGGEMTNTVIETKTIGNLSIGYRGSLGMSYQFTKMISFNLEAFYTSLYIKANNRVMETYSVDGSSVLESLPTYVREIEFVDELNNSSNNPTYNSSFDIDSPMDMIVSPTNFSQLGFEVGFKFNF